MQKGTQCIFPNGHEGIIYHVDSDVEDGVVYAVDDDSVWVMDITSAESLDHPDNQTGWWEPEHLGG